MLKKKDIHTSELIAESNEDVLTNQTQFAGEEPLFEKTSVPVVEEEQTEAEATAKMSQKRQQKKLFVFGWFLMVLILVLFLIMLVVMPPRQTLQPTPVPSPTLPPQPEQTQLQQRIEEASRDLKAADPTLLDLQFPPVSFEISLEKTER